MNARRIVKVIVSPRAVFALELMLTAAISLLAALVFWLLFGPVHTPPLSVVPAVASAPAEVGGPRNPFRTASAPPAAVENLEFGPDLAETSLNLVLHGTWIDEKGGSAIIRTPSDEQKRVHAGDVIWENVVLERVYRDQVVISRGGVRESLRLINREASPIQNVQAGGRPGVLQSAAGLTRIGGLIAVIGQPDGVGGVRLVLEPAGDLVAFERLGLRRGDVLVAVDNQSVGPDIASAIGYLQSLGALSEVDISVERDGVVTPLTVPLGDDFFHMEEESGNEG